MAGRFGAILDLILFIEDLRPSQPWTEVGWNEWEDGGRSKVLEWRRNYPCILY